MVFSGYLFKFYPNILVRGKKYIKSQNTHIAAPKKNSEKESKRFG